jgi:hypothetical protein
MEAILAATIPVLITAAMPILDRVFNGLFSLIGL